MTNIMMIKPTFAYVFSNILLFLNNVSDLDLLLKLTTFFAYMIFMLVAISEKISAIKKGGYLENYKGSWKVYLIETVKEFLDNLKNGK
jgi:hypothetical protein